MRKEKVYMPRLIRTVSVLGLLGLSLAGAHRLAGQAPPGGPQTPPPAGKQPQRSLRIEYPPLFFREDWKLDPNAPNVNTADERSGKGTWRTRI